MHVKKALIEPNSSLKFQERPLVWKLIDIMLNAMVKHRKWCFKVYNNIITFPLITSLLCLFLTFNFFFSNLFHSISILMDTWEGKVKAKSVQNNLFLILPHKYSFLQCFPTQLCRSDTSSRLQHWHIPDPNKNNKKISANTFKLMGENWKNVTRTVRGEWAGDSACFSLSIFKSDSLQWEISRK